MENLRELQNSIRSLLLLTARPLLAEAIFAVDWRSQWKFKWVDIFSFVLFFSEGNCLQRKSAGMSLLPPLPLPPPLPAYTNVTFFPHRGDNYWSEGGKGRRRDKKEQTLEIFDLWKWFACLLCCVLYNLVFEGGGRRGLRLLGTMHIHHVSTVLRFDENRARSKFIFFGGNSTVAASCMDMEAYDKEKH